MKIVASADAEVLTRDRVRSLQIISQKSGISRAVAITRVTVEAGGVQPRHRHAASEQIWVVLAGRATLLLDGDQEEPMSAGHTYCFEPGEVQGIRNDSGDVFEYLTVTSPPESFEAAYDTKR
jgi:quercetin dioxygenase-like cupin family protein